MDKKLLVKSSFILFFAFISFFVYQFVFKNEIMELNSSVSRENSQELQGFLYENRGKFVKLSVSLCDDMVKNILDGTDEENKITFRAIDIENPTREVKYLIRLLDDGRRDFDFNKNSGRLSGYFKTYKRVAPDGSSIINLVPIPEKSTL